jgi:hypothetical protein
MTYSYFISVEITSESPSSPDLSGLESQSSVDETAPELLNSQDALFPPLIHCTHPIESIAARLATQLKWLVHSLHTVEARMMVQSSCWKINKTCIHHHCFVMYV